MDESKMDESRVSSLNSGIIDELGVDYRVSLQNGETIDEIEENDSRVLDTSFEIGDMVWGKVKSHPWWPGHLFNEAFANSSVRRSRRHGLVLVAFFGDSSYGWFDPTELVPYDPHYEEKSEQTNSRSFVRAVEDSIDEASRRSALGLSCRCRNVANFREVSVPGYLAVDVVDYEPGAIYSLSQIRKARDDFRPANALSFIKELAVAPMSGETKKLDFIKNKAATLAYRRSVFEEFDETYAEAFNQPPLRTSQGLPDKQPSRAPLSGPLVIADTLGGRKSSTKTIKIKEQSKKDRYLFKRRDKAGDAKATETTQVHAGSSSSPAYEDGFVFQKRESVVSNDELGGVSTARDQVATSIQAGPTKDAPIAGNGEMVPSPVTADLSNVLDKALDGQIPTKEGVIKKKKVPKRPVGEQSFENSDRPKKKMKKVKKTDGQSSIDLVVKDPVLSGGAVKEKKESFQGSQFRKDNEATNSGLSQVGLSELSQMLADLRGLALNPVYGLERHGLSVMRDFFLKFRSLIYVKSSAASAQAEPEPSEKPSMEGGKVISSSKLKKLSAKHDDQAKGLKRTPSERQEEKAVKRAKKITEVKSLSAEKRALLKTPDKSKMGAPQNSQSKPIIKSEQGEKKIDHPARIEEPTYLIMKFQSSSSLPSLGELKARFARFGPLNVSLNRVFYKTNTCRVAFLYKQDANVAYRYAMGSKTLFSNVKFMLKPVFPPESQNPSSAKVEDVQTESTPNRDSLAPEARLVGPTLTAQQTTPQLKSCLKKPSGSDEVGGNGRTARVRFNMGEVKGGSNDNRVGLQGPKIESRNSMLSTNESFPSSSQSSSSVAMDISNNQRFNVSSHPLQPPLLPLPPQFIRPPINQQFHHMVELSPRNNWHDNNPKIIPPPPFPEKQAPTPPQPSPQPIAPLVPPNKDISHQMMSLLTRCHDVVTNVKSVLGYVPYHPL